MPIGRVLPSSGQRQELRSLTTVGDFEFAEASKFAPGSFVAFKVGPGIRPTAVEVVLLSEVKDPNVLSEALTATDSDARTEALVLLGARETPEKLVAACERALLQVPSAISNIADLVLEALESRTAEWKGEFQRAVDESPQLSQSIIPRLLQLGHVSSAQELIRSIRSLERLSKSSLRDRLTSILVKAASSSGLLALPNRELTECSLPALQETAREVWFQALLSNHSPELWTTTANGSVSDWLEERVLKSASIPFLEANLDVVALKFSNEARLKLLKKLVAEGQLLLIREYVRLANLTPTSEVAALMPDELVMEPPWCFYISFERAVSVMSLDSDIESRARCAEAWLGNSPSERQRADTQARHRFAGTPTDEQPYLRHVEREKLYEALPDDLARHPRVLTSAPPRAVVAKLYRPEISAEEWADLPVIVRLVWTHRELWHREDPLADHPLLHDAHNLIQALRALYPCIGADNNPQDRVDRFDVEMRRFLLQQIVDHPNALLDLRPILPDCIFVLKDASMRDLTPNVAHCEGRFWAPGQRNPRGARAWCPRSSRGCLKATLMERPIRYSSSLEGARIDALQDAAWEWASIVEICAELGAVPLPPGLARNEQYGTAIGGWANRLNEIRSRLTCGVCQRQLHPNFAYAMDPGARYNKTFFLCREGHYAEPGRYFNHCWCCDHTIDSDESPHQARRQIRDANVVHGLHYCIHCGAGPEPDDNRQCDIGEVCPRCGDRHQMELLRASTDEFADLQCLQPGCGHRIRVPLRSVRNGIRNRVNYAPPHWWERANGLHPKNWTI